MNATKTCRLIDLFIRYSLFGIVLITGSALIERLIAMPTIYVLYGILRQIYPMVFLENAYIFVNGQVFEIASECVMGVVYWCLLLLVLATADLRLSVRLLAIALTGFSVFVFNILRMIFLVSIVHSPYFDSTHWIFENIIAAVVLVLAWFTIVRWYHVKSVPLYSDLKYLLSN